jgi:hypothetical protein
VAIFNRDRVARGFETPREALIPFVERELSRTHGASWR